MKPREKKLDKVFRYLHLYNKIYLMYITSNSDKMKSYDLKLNSVFNNFICIFYYSNEKKHLPLLQDQQDGDNIFHNEIESFHIKVCANIYSLIYPSGIISSNISCQHNLLGIRFHFER